MAANAWVVHDKFKQYMGSGAADLDADTFRMALYLSTSNIATTSIDAKSTATNEHANANGYTTGGVIVAATWVESAGTVTFDCADASWTASGGSIVCRFAALFDDTIATPVVDPIVAHSLLDNTPADITTTTGNTFQVQINVAGAFTLA